MLKERCDDGWREAFARLFPVILTDNGSEFSNPAAIESDDDGRLTSVFYCKAYASYQKPHVERNHEFIRTLIPENPGIRVLQLSTCGGGLIVLCPSRERNVGSICDFMVQCAR